MAINKKLIHFKSEEAFKRELEAGNILETSICWVPDAKFIYTRGSYWYCPYSKEKIDSEFQAVYASQEGIMNNVVDLIQDGDQANADALQEYKDLMYEETNTMKNGIAENKENLRKETQDRTSQDTYIEGQLDGLKGSLPAEVLSGSITVTPDASTVAISTSKYIKTDYGWYPDTAVTQAVTLAPATETTAGVMTAEDKKLLQKITKPLNYKGSVATYDDLPTNALEGDVYNVVKTDVNYAWTGTEWDPFGSSATNIVNDLTTGGIGSALSAEQGKVLKGLVDTNTTAITAEETRAMQAEADNTALIRTETDRAKKAEDELRAAASGSVVADSGDIPVMPLYRQAHALYNKPAEAEDLETCPLAVYVLSYNKPYVGKPINRVKMMLGTTGRCRISIFNKNIFKARPTEEASLVKDLVNVVCTSTGYKYWDLDEDVIVGEDQYIGAWFTQDCARYTYANNLTYQTAYPSSWNTRKTTTDIEVPDEKIGSSFTTGYLNVGLYQRGEGSDFEWGKIDESASSPSNTVDSYGPMGQEKLVGKTIYKLRMNVATPGYFTVNVVNNFGKPGGSLYKSWKLYIRQQGVQTVRLPEDIVLKEGQGIVFNGEGTTCVFKFGGTAFGTKYALDGFYTYVNHDFTVTPSQNANRLNIGFIERGGKLSALEDKTISIQGDSISTFAGTITDGNATYYSPTHKYVNSIDATWWGLLINECRMRLVRNDAQSGSRVSGVEASAMSNSARCINLRNTDSTIDTYPLASPEIIVIMCGTNDVGGGVDLGTFNPEDGTGVGDYTSAFNTMLRRVKTHYPFSKIVVFQLLRGNALYYKNSKNTYQYQYLEAMEDICKRAGVYYIDPGYLGISNSNIQYFTCDNTMESYGPPTYTGCDYLHPNMQGMERIYAGVRSFLEGLY